jgi:hypothetical protein
VALFGDFGRIFEQAFRPIVAPTVAVVQAASGNPKGAVSTLKGAVEGNPLVRTALAAAASGARRQAVDNPQNQPGPQQMADQYGPGPMSFQPTQFSGGSYDPNLGGGYPSWDYSIFSAPIQATPSYRTFPNRLDSGVWGD